MRRNRRRNGGTIVYGTAAFLGFLVLFLFGFSTGKPVQKADGARIVVFGDSIVGECRDETSVAALLSGLLGEPVFNGGLGGTCFSYTDEEMRIAYTKDCLNMAGLSQAILIDDFRVQKNARIRESVTEYFDDTIEELSEIDFDSVDIVFLAYGLNDYHAAVELANENDPYDPHTFTGAIRFSVENLRRAHPRLRIILVTPTYAWYRYNGITCEEYDTGGGILEDYVEAEIELAEELGLEIIDLYHDFYAHNKWEDWETYTNDGLHPNEKGRGMIAGKLADYLVY